MRTTREILELAQAQNGLMQEMVIRLSGIPPNLKSQANSVIVQLGKKFRELKQELEKEAK